MDGGPWKKTWYGENATLAEQIELGELTEFIATAACHKQIRTPKLSPHCRVCAGPCSKPVPGEVWIIEIFILTLEDSRWVHVLDFKRKQKPWTWEEYQRLLYGVKLFGRDKLSKISMLLPGRNNMDVRARIRLLMRHKIEVYFSPLSLIITS
jgi:hypothetical protein